MPLGTILASGQDAVDRYLRDSQRRMESTTPSQNGETIHVPTLRAPRAVDLVDGTRLHSQEYNTLGRAGQFAADDIPSQPLSHTVEEEIKIIKENRVLRLKEKEENITIGLTRLFNNGVMQSRYTNTFRDERRDTIIVSANGKILMEISPTHIKHIKSVNNKDLIEKFARDNNRTIEEVDRLNATGRTETATRTNWWVKLGEKKVRTVGVDNHASSYERVIGQFPVYGSGIQ